MATQQGAFQPRVTCLPHSSRPGFVRMTRAGEAGLATTRRDKSTEATYRCSPASDFLCTEYAATNESAEFLVPKAALLKCTTFNKDADGGPFIMDYRDNFVSIPRLDDKLSADGHNHFLALVMYVETSFASYGEANLRWLKVRCERNDGSGFRGRRRYERNNRSAFWQRLRMVSKVWGFALKED
jgi:hypothetical protein